MNKNNTIKLALLIGAFSGAIFAVTTQLQIAFLNCCLCFATCLPGFLAVYLSIRDEVKAGITNRMKLADGAIAGLAAGLAMGITSTVLSLFYNALISKSGGREALEQAFKEAVNRAQDDQSRESITRVSQYVLEHYLLMVVIFAILGTIFYMIFSGLGGMLAVGLFDDRKATTPPPPPTQSSTDYNYRGYQPPIDPSTIDSQSSASSSNPASAANMDSSNDKSSDINQESAANNKNGNEHNPS
jgi:hypothetical protein